MAAADSARFSVCFTRTHGQRAETCIHTHTHAHTTGTAKVKDRYARVHARRYERGRSEHASQATSIGVHKTNPWDTTFCIQPSATRRTAFIVDWRFRQPGSDKARAKSAPKVTDMACRRGSSTHSVGVARSTLSLCSSCPLVFLPQHTHRQQVQSAERGRIGFTLADIR